MVAHLFLAELTPETAQLVNICITPVKILDMKVFFLT
jgi:hypothetical protein